MTEIPIIGDDGAGRVRRGRFDYPGNSQRAKAAPEQIAERPKQEKVITGEAVARKRGVLSRVTHDFIAEDGRSVMQYVILEVLLPAAKSTISDVVSQGIERMLYGEAKRGPRAGYTNYQGRGRAVAPMSDPRPVLSRQARANHEFGEVVVTTRAEAEDVLDKLRELINVYNVASVADFKECLGWTPEFTDNTWGWDDLRSAQVRAVRGGYVIDLPRTQPLA